MLRYLRICLIVLAAVALLQTLSWGQQPAAQPEADTLKPLAENAPEDQPGSIHDAEELKKFEEAIAPYVAKARATFPNTKIRFKKGLQKGEALFVTVRLYDSNHKFEQVFVEVKSWKDTSITGLLASKPQLVKDHKLGEKMTSSEKDIYDWTVSKPDGTEDGNFVGNFLDTYHP